MPELLQRFLEAGYTYALFLDLTPALFVIHMDAAVARAKHEQRGLREQAWLTAKLQRVQKIPELVEIIEPDDERDPEEIAAEKRARQRAFGAELPRRTWSEWQQR